MELRQTEQGLSELVHQYKSICLKSLQQEPSNGSNVYDDVPDLLDWEDVMKSRQNDPEVQTSTSVSKEIKEEDKTKSITAHELLDALNQIRSSLNDLVNKIEKFRSRLKMKDPVTKAPRYGKKTIERVENLLETYEILQSAIDYAFGSDSDSVVEALQKIIQTEKENCDKALAKEESMRLQREKQEKEEKLKAELESNRKEEMEKLKQEKEREELSRKAEEARKRRIEKEQKAIEEEREAERSFLASIEVGLNGVKSQLHTLKETCTDSEFDVCLKSLHTVFKQISSKPEQVQFRRIRCNHPQFMDNIGKNRGGKELLIAAGFQLISLDGVKCLFNPEPDLATDMDAWSSWFDLVKGTYQILDEELNK